MKIKLNRNEILSSLQTATNLTSLKSGATYLKIIWFKIHDNLLEIYATDTKIEYQSKIKVDYKGNEILFGCSGRHIYELIKKLPFSQIVIEIDPKKNFITLQQEKRNYKLPTFDKSWFQEFKAIENDNYAIFSGQLLKKCIDKIHFCIADDSIENMNYLNISKTKKNNQELIDICGLNNHQFALITIKNNELYKIIENERLLIAKGYLTELKKWLPDEEIKIYNNNNKLSITSENDIFSIPLSITQFPDYTKFINLFENKNTMKINRLELIDALERISLFTEDMEKCCYFVIEEDELFIYSQGQESGEGNESLPIEFQGDLNKICFPTKKLIEILIHFDTDDILFNFTSADGPCKITDVPEDDYLVVLMPIKIEEEVYYTDEEIS